MPLIDRGIIEPLRVSTPFQALRTLIRGRHQEDILEQRERVFPYILQIVRLRRDTHSIVA